MCRYDSRTGRRAQHYHGRSYRPHGNANNSSRSIAVQAGAAELAVKYNREEGNIEIDCADTGLGHLCFTVKDQGTGVPEAKRHGIFEPFNRAGAEDLAVPGTGIGLAIAKQMVELMGGEIGVRNAEGGGSQFWFTVPTTQAGQETS